MKKEWFLIGALLLLVLVALVMLNRAPQEENDELTEENTSLQNELNDLRDELFPQRRKPTLYDFPSEGMQ